MLCCLQADDTLAVSVNLKPTPDMMHKLAEYLVSQEQVCECMCRLDPQAHAVSQGGSVAQRVTCFFTSCGLGVCTEHISSTQHQAAGASQAELGACNIKLSTEHAQPRPSAYLISNGQACTVSQQGQDTVVVLGHLCGRHGTVHFRMPLMMPQDTFLIPLQVNVPGQPLPLPVKLRLQATTSDLHLRPRTLDFGKVPLSEAAGVQLTLTNPSLLPQSFSFGAKLPLGLKISPNAGVLEPLSWACADSSSTPVRHVGASTKCTPTCQCCMQGQCVPSRLACG